MATERPLTNRYDPYTLKQRIDEEVVSFLKEKKFGQDFLHSNLKIILATIGALATGFAYAYEYLFHAGFPKNWYCLFYCAIIYFTCNLIFQFIEYFVQKECFFESSSFQSVTLQKALASKLATFNRIRFSSTFDKFGDEYKFTVQVYDKDGQPKSIERNDCFGSFFKSDGFIVPNKVNDFVTKALQDIK